MTALTFVILAGAAFRLARLIGWDTITARPRSWLVRQGTTGGCGGCRDRAMGARLEFLTCSFCLGFWTSIAVYGAWLLWPHGSMYVFVPLALSAAVGLVGKNWDA